MPDQQLRDHVLQRAADADDLSEAARRVVLAAWRDLPADAAVGVGITRLDAEVDVLTRHQAATRTVPDADEVERACATLRSAASAQALAERAADTLSADRVQFLETSLEFHDRHGAQPCPVCAATTLDDAWVGRARTALTAEKDAASARRVARSGAHRARQALMALVRAVDAPPPEDAGVPAIVAARVAYEAFSTLSADDDTDLADRVATALPGLRAAYAALDDEVAPRLAAVGYAVAWARALPTPTATPREQT